MINNQELYAKINNKLKTPFFILWYYIKVVQNCGIKKTKTVLKNVCITLPLPMHHIYLP